MNKHERKYANTTQRLHNALIILLEKKDFIDISIKEVCEKAGINRSTFYAHYENTAELAFDMEKTIIEEFESENSELFTKNISELPKSNDIYIDDTILSVYLEFVKNHKRIFSIYNNSMVFNRPNNERILKETVFIPAFKAYGINDTVVMDYLFTYYMAGVNSIICKWVNEDCTVPVLTICDIIRRGIIKQ